MGNIFPNQSKRRKLIWVAPTAFWNHLKPQIEAIYAHITVHTIRFRDKRDESRYDRYRRKVTSWSGDKSMIDPITLEVIWRRLISIVDEQAAALIHSSFTTVVREAGDLSAGLFDRGRQHDRAIGHGHAGPHQHHGQLRAQLYRAQVPPSTAWTPGDTLITNDPLGSIGPPLSTSRLSRRYSIADAAWPSSPAPATRWISAARPWAGMRARFMKRAWLFR